jgi:hypothetical protein
MCKAIVYSRKKKKVWPALVAASAEFARLRERYRSLARLRARPPALLFPAHLKSSADLNAL